MENDKKMGTLQACSIIITVMISHIILNMPNHLIAFTGPSTILNLIYVFIIALVIFYIAAKILEKFPGKDLIDIAEYVGGKTLKYTLSIAACIYFLTLCAYVIRTFSESLVLIYFPNINLEIVILMFIVIAVAMNLFGFKAISRVTLITLPLILFSMIIIFISSASDFTLERALPLLGYGASTTFLSGLRKYICV